MDFDGAIMLVSVAAGLLALVWFIAKRRPLWRSFGFGVERWTPVEVCLGALVPFIAFCGVFAIESALGAIVVGPGVAGGGIWSNFSQFLGDGFFEEILFRVFLVNGLVVTLQKLPAHRWIVVFLSAAIFGAAHLTNPNGTILGAVGTGFGGVIYAFAFLATRRIWLGLALHVSWNFSQAAWGFPVSGSSGWWGWVSSKPEGNVLLNGGDYGPEASLPGLAARIVVFLAVLGYLYARWRGGRLTALAFAPESRRARRDVQTANGSATV